MAYMHIDDKVAPYLEILLDCIKLHSDNHMPADEKQLFAKLLEVSKN